MIDYFKNDDYWKEHINKPLEDDLWIDEYKNYLDTNGLCLDLGCGIGQYTKRFMEYGYSVISADISSIALNKVREFNNMAIMLDMRDVMPFYDGTFDVVFANLSIHYFSDKETKKIISEVNRVLKPGGLFIGSVNGMEGYEAIKDTAEPLDYHFYFNLDKYIRLFNQSDLKNYLYEFNILRLDNRETVRFGRKKNHIIFVARKR